MTEPTPSARYSLVQWIFVGVFLLVGLGLFFALVQDVPPVADLILP